ncbi:MAG: DUF3307 domain-containing protein [Proteobacteria bacterium]|nr:MAG: DUF3307 domain-containing protein [Pseudomonadota bacterium]
MNIPLSLIITHFIADFVLQNDWMAHGKSKRFAPLFIHCLIYSSCFLLWGLKFAVFTGILHFIVDFVTSRINIQLWNLQSKHWFFVSIGLDQLVHYVCLAAVFNLI